jgi:hypothetical protein
LQGIAIHIKICLNDLGSGYLENFFFFYFGFITFTGGARLPAFYTCVGANDQLLTPDWYKKHGRILSVFTGFYVICALHVAIPMFS